MAHYTIPEEAETALWRADEALAFVETLAAQAGEQQIEVKGSEAAAFLALVRGLIHEARSRARFSAT